jgi:hypothetical protein
MADDDDPPPHDGKIGDIVEYHGQWWVFTPDGWQTSLPISTWAEKHVAPGYDEVLDRLHEHATSRRRDRDF